MSSSVGVRGVGRDLATAVISSVQDCTHTTYGILLVVVFRHTQLATLVRENVRKCLDGPLRAGRIGDIVATLVVCSAVAGVGFAR